MHVDDCAEAMVGILEEPRTPSRAFELGASEIFIFRELIEQCAKPSGVDLGSCRSRFRLPKQART